MGPIVGGGSGTDPWPMLQLAIRCHPFLPVEAEELEAWLERQVVDLRAEAPHATMRLSRLTQSRPDADLDVGWLVEVELDEGEPLLAGRRLAETLRDMRLLGLQPTLLAPREGAANGMAGKNSRARDANPACRCAALALTTRTSNEQ
jgi:hypothetical protein